jgi:acetate kinase
MKFLAFNAGGRSHRVIAYDVDAAAAAKLEPAASFWDAEDESATTHFRDLIADAPQPDVAVHRVVHGGLHGELDDDAPVDARVIGAIEDAIEFAPGHNRLALDGIAAVTERFGDAVRQVVVLDHALRADAPRVATMLSGPSAWASDHAMRRIGFHGISHHDVIERVLALLGRDDARVVTVHVGSGCSLAAFHGRRMLDTTMGMTPMAGVMMTERAGDVDPGALLFLLRHGLEDVASLEQQLNHASGLLGLSGVSADTRDCYAAIDAGNERAAHAMELFVYRLRLAVGAFAATLGGVDAISFSGPAGEHQPRLRAAVCEHLAYLGIAIDARRNDAAVADAEIGAAGAGARAFAIRTLEEWAMVRRAARVVSPGA